MKDDHPDHRVQAVRHRIPEKLLVLATATSLAGFSLFRGAANAAPGDDSSKGSTVHVFPGTVPLNSKQDSAASQPPEEEPTAPSAKTEPMQTIPSAAPESSSVPTAGDNDEKPSQTAATDDDARTDEEKDAQTQIQAAQHYALAAHPHPSPNSG